MEGVCGIGAVLEDDETAVVGTGGGTLGEAGVGNCGGTTAAIADVDALDAESGVFGVGGIDTVLGFLLKSDRSLVTLLPTRGPDTFFADEPGRFNGSNRNAVGVVLVGVVGPRLGVAMLFLPELPTLFGPTRGFLVGVVVGDAPTFGETAMIDLHFLRVQLKTAGEEEDILCAASCDTSVTPNLGVHA